MSEIKLPVIVIDAGGIPQVGEMVYERPEGEKYYEPKYSALKTAMNDVMLERVKLASGLVMWCDEEGRLVDEPKVVCNVRSPYYRGDMVGDRVIMALEHGADTGLFEPLFSDVITEETRSVLAGEILHAFGVRMIMPPNKGQKAAPPKIEVTFDGDDK